MTKTQNPLHFEDLDPHRFEDLVRQIVYDFRNWSVLEPTGRLGADDGYDARGFEIVTGEIIEAEDVADENDDTTPVEREQRLWQIQCKREKSIGPGKLTKYIEEMIPKGSTTPYGVIFAAPTDFSKKARDACREILRKKGVKEFYLWGKADLEDMLFQPKNDHLLYAYFGISLQIQRRSERLKLRSILAAKRKAIKHLGDVTSMSFKDVLIRDVEDDSYPYSGNVPDFKKRPHWKKYYFIGHDHDGILLLVRKYFAYRDVEFGPDGGKVKAWDSTDRTNLGPEDHWNEDAASAENHHRVHKFWDALDERNQAYFEIIGKIKYENIVEIDSDGDIYAHCPHVYVRVNPNSFFEPYVQHRLVSSNRWAAEVYLPQDAEKLRIKIFPDEFPEAATSKEEVVFPEEDKKTS